MSQHSSLKSGSRRKRHRSVLKRYERIKSLENKELWKEGDSVFGLPKVKTIRFKIKKEKAAEAAAPAEGEAAPVAPETQAAAAPPKEKKEAAKKETPPKKEKGK